MGISSKVAERISAQLKKYQGILAEAKNRDIGESDTVIIIVGMLADILGYNKHTEITTEYSVRGTYVDLAVKVGNDVRFLIEAKAIGVSLKDNHVKQAIDYGANNGIEWVVLTNGVHWQVYKVHFKQPIDNSLIYEFDALQVSPKLPQMVECLGNLSREGFTQSSMTAFSQQRQLMSKFSVAALLLSEPVLKVLRREIRRVGQGCKVEVEDLKALLRTEILKREVFDGDDAKQATEYLKKAAKSAEKARAKAASDEQAAPPPKAPADAPPGGTS